MGRNDNINSILSAQIRQQKADAEKQAYLDGIAGHLSKLKVNGLTLDRNQLLGADLSYGAELFGLQEFSPKVQTDILLSLAYFRSTAFRERVDTSLGYAPGSYMNGQDIETYNQVVERASEAYRDITFEVENNISKSHNMITFDGRSIVHIPDGNDLHEHDSKLYSSLGVTTHEIAHYIYNSAVPEAINPGIYHQDEGETLTPSNNYGKDNSPFNRINESKPSRKQVADWYAKMFPEQLARHEHIDIMLIHDNTGFERAADFHAARMIMLQEGIWNPFGNEPLKKEHIEQFRQRHPDSRIFEYWNDKEATYFLNTIAQGEQEKRYSVGQKHGIQQEIRNNDSHQVGQEKPLSAETLKAMSSMNFEIEMQSLNESLQERRSAGVHI